MQHLFRIEDLVEVLLKLLPSLVDIFGAFVRDPENLLLGERRSK